MEIDVKEICKQLQRNERQIKYDACSQLQRICEHKEVSTEYVMRCFDDCYLYLLKCYADRYESVRDNAVQTVTKFIVRLPPNDFHLLNVVATLADRMGQQETIEESEEIRLSCVLQTNILLREYVSTGNVASLKTCYEDIVRVLIKAVRDPYPAVQREGCACIVVLASAAETFDFEKFSEMLAIPLYGMLNHKHSLARIAAVEALSRLALHLTAKHEPLTRLITEVSPLLMDSMPLVRREVGQMGVLLLLELRDRYSYFDRLIPLVLCGLKDDSPDVVDHIRPLWQKCGKQYYDENELELNKQDIADTMPENYPYGVDRPTIGCRGLVQRSLRLLKLIMRESSDWKVNVRVHSMKLLYQFVLHAEATMTALFFEIYADMARACRDDDAQAVEEATKVADLMGRLLCYDDWIEHGLDGLTKYAKLGYLKCFYYMFTATLGGTFDHLMRIAKLMQTAEFSQTLKPEFQLYVLRMLETLLDKLDKMIIEYRADLVELEESIYVSAVKVMALAISVQGADSNVIDHGELIMDRIVCRQKSSVATLHEQYFAHALGYLDSLDAALESNCEPILLLNGLLSIANFRATYMTPLQEKLKLVWQYCAEDAQISTFSTVSIAMLSWEETIGVDHEESANLLRTFITEIVEPHLAWSAGTAAEAMRSMATATICSVATGAPNEAPLVLAALHKYMPNLLEDHSISTRHYAVKAMCNFGPVPVEDLKPLAYAVLQRMDDPSSDIRVKAATALAQIQPLFTDAEYEHEVWDMFIKRALDMLFLQYQGPELKLKAAIECSLLHLQSQYPEMYEERHSDALSKGCNLDVLETNMQNLKLEGQKEKESEPTVTEPEVPS